ncbi:MAG TPA: YceI family protein [Thermoanaerobaculia bacterium]|nr:YceI family protein [Thermoanaerobaculia bacterium]
MNVDRQELPSVDVVVDVTAGLPFDDAAALFAEHFLEHLPLDEALAFLLEAHRVLAADGRLRLSTPNLDWVLATQDPRARANAASAALCLNRAFYGWSHRFLWNQPLLAEALAAAGFVDLRWCRHGESEWEPFRGLERHEPYDDAADLPHVLIVEAQKGPPQPARLAAFRRLLRDEFLELVRPRGWAIDPARSAVVAHLYVAGPLRPLVREHVIRAAWVGGSVQLSPEAPEESNVTVDVDTRHLLVDEPTMRALGRQSRLPRWFRRRVEAQLRGHGYLDVERWPLIRFRSCSLHRRPGGGVTVSGELELLGRSVPLQLDVQTTFEGDAWRAQGQVVLDTRAVGLPTWKLAGGLLHATTAMRIDVDLHATPVNPT